MSEVKYAVITTYLSSVSSKTTRRSFPGDRLCAAVAQRNDRRALERPDPSFVALRRSMPREFPASPFFFSPAGLCQFLSSHPKHLHPTRRERKPSYTTDVCRIMTHVFGFFRQVNLGFRVRPQRLSQVVFDLFDSGGRAAPTARHPVPKACPEPRRRVPALRYGPLRYALRATQEPTQDWRTVPIVQPLSFDFASLRSGQALRSSPSNRSSSNATSAVCKRLPFLRPESQSSASWVPAAPSTAGPLQTVS